jgi:hypothetical protein
LGPASGTDFQGRPGAYSRLNRTTIELSVSEGHLEDSEIVAICTCLVAIDARRARVIEATRFATLTYWSRHDAPLPDVPLAENAITRRERHGQDRSV